MSIGLFSYAVFFLSIVLILGIVALGLNLQWGYTGLFNAGIAGFYAIGAYTHAIITTAPRADLMANMGLPWIVGIVGAMAVTALAAWIVGIATIRLRGDYLAISTFGIAVTIQLVTLNFEPLTGGSQGFTGIPRPLLRLARHAARLQRLLSGAADRRRRSGLLGTGAHPALALGPRAEGGARGRDGGHRAGKSAIVFRLQAFVIGSTLMGLAGALYVSFIGFVSPFDFLPIVTFQIWAMVIVGGSGNNKGALLGAFFVWTIWAFSGVAITKLVPPAYAAQGGAIQVILIGLMLVLALLFRPRGLIGEETVVSRHAARD